MAGWARPPFFCLVVGLLVGPAASAGAGSLSQTLVGAGAPPDARMFPKVSGHMVPPTFTEVVGPKNTNKFWANWVVERGADKPIYPMPFALGWRQRGGCRAGELMVSNGKPQYQYSWNGRVQRYSTRFDSEVALGAVEELAPGGHVVVSEGLFGVHVEVRGRAASGGEATPKVTYPIYSGMAYISGRYEGGLTPRLSAAPRRIQSIEKVRDGVWTFTNSGSRKFRVYALTQELEFVNASFDFDQSGSMSRPLDGWLRIALLTQESDAEVLDAHARAVVVDMEVDVMRHGRVHYRFATPPARYNELPPPPLHFAYAHHVKMLSGLGQNVSSLAPVRAPTKGVMRGIVGRSWRLSVNVSEAENLGFLPAGDVAGEKRERIQKEVTGTLEWLFKKSSHWKRTIFQRSYYFSGKGFQKVATVCLLSEEFFGREDERTQGCANILARGFRCLYDRERAGDCQNAPVGHFYDEEWGGLPSREGFRDSGCFGRTDFGNACYNDHHYHYGYFVVSAAVLVKLKPASAGNFGFVSYINSLIRDTANPSSADPFFPRFRSFDWFDLHSWSRGVVPSTDGKDQESTSEEMNLHYGVYLWGRMIRKPALRHLGATMMSLCSATIQEYFLMKDGNPHHPEGFVRNRVTGIFFQNRVDYTTWFGHRPEFIHSIQMLPLTPALMMSRTQSFCKQEFDDIVSRLPLRPTSRWTSILLTGSMAMGGHAEEAYDRLLHIRPDMMDDGLTRAYALYWAAALASPRMTMEESSETSSTSSRAPAAKADVTVMTALPSTAAGSSEDEEEAEVQPRAEAGGDRRRLESTAAASVGATAGSAAAFVAMLLVVAVRRRFSSPDALDAACPLGPGTEQGIVVV